MFLRAWFDDRVTTFTEGLDEGRQSFSVVIDQSLFHLIHTVIKWTDSLLIRLYWEIAFSSRCHTACKFWFRITDDTDDWLLIWRSFAAIQYRLERLCWDCRSELLQDLSEFGWFEALEPRLIEAVVLNFKLVCHWYLVSLSVFLFVWAHNWLRIN